MAPPPVVQQAQPQQSTEPRLCRRPPERRTADLPGSDDTGTGPHRRSWFAFARRYGGREGRTTPPRFARRAEQPQTPETPTPLLPPASRPLRRSEARLSSCPDLWRGWRTADFVEEERWRPASPASLHGLRTDRGLGTGL